MFLPLAGFLFCIPAFLLVFEGEVAAVHYFYGATSLHDFRVNKFVWAGLAFPLYFVCDCIVIFFNAALVDACLAILKGEEISFSDTLGAAWSRWPQLLSWSFVCAAVSVLMLALRGNNRNSSNLGGWLMGIGWRIACYLVLPILVAQGLGPIRAVQESVALVRKSWKEGLAGGVGLNSVGCVLVLAGVVLFYVILKIAGAAAGPKQDAELLLAFGSVALVIAVLLSTLGMIFRCGLYLYATTGRAPAGLPQDAVQQAFGS
jgi:hypothetical protein